MVEQHHEPGVHVILLMAMEEDLAGIVRSEDYLRLRSCRSEKYILPNPLRGRSVDLFHFKGVPVKMHRMNIVALIV